MSNFISITDLKNTSLVSSMCSQSTEPIFISENGCSTMVIMDINVYEEKIRMLDVYSSLIQAEYEIREDKSLDAKSCLNALRDKYNL